ncbi:MAG: asparagine synthetase [Thaumarchaeota archaeon]|nr:MAG: asparagine synthetase [Nitrososphaerota archaeon]
MKAELESFPELEKVASVERLRDEKKRVIFRVKTEVLKTMTNDLLEKGFYWILPVMLARATDPLWPDPGASIEKRIELEIYGVKVRTMQSMILHKRVLVSLGPEKFFIYSPNIRIERRERALTGRHLYEFTQLEVEMAYAKMEDVFRVYEDLIAKSIKVVKERLGDELKFLGRDSIKIPETPFKVFKRREIEEKYGTDWELKLSRDLKDPAWVTDIPREFYDYEDEEAGEWRNFDLILPEGYGEVISGAEREYEYEKMLKKIERDGLRKEDYEFILSLAKRGLLKPSAGAGLGVERFIAYICGVRHVAEVQPFPRMPGIVSEL